MKNVILATLLLFLSCSTTEGHYHDGTYNISVYSMDFGTIILNGNEITVKYSNEFFKGGVGEIKTKCIQYPDRVEFEEKGVTNVGRFDKDGNLQLSGFVFKKKH